VRDRMRIALPVWLCTAQVKHACSVVDTAQRNVLQGCIVSIRGLHCVISVS